MVLDEFVIDVQVLPFVLGALLVDTRYFTTGEGENLDILPKTTRNRSGDGTTTNTQNERGRRVYAEKA